MGKYKATDDRDGHGCKDGATDVTDRATDDTDGHG